MPMAASSSMTCWHGPPPTSTPLEVRMYRKELHEKIDALPYADRTPIVTEPTNAASPSTQRRRAAQLASYSLKHLLASYSRCINCFKHKQQAIQPNNSALLACQHAHVSTHMYAHVDLQLDVDVGSGISARYIFCLCFLPYTLDPALCFRFKNEFSTSSPYLVLFFVVFSVPCQLANARVAEADAPSHHYNTTTAVNRGSCSEYSKGGSSASSRSQRDDIYDSHTNNFAKGKRLGKQKSCPSALVVSLLLHVPRAIV
jgi:hypothetical protein